VVVDIEHKLKLHRQNRHWKKQRISQV